jgi:hypothetical protein
MKFQFVSFVMFVVVVVVAPSSSLRVRLMPYISPIFNVLDYGAVGNGKNDESRVCFLGYFICFILMYLI